MLLSLCFLDSLDRLFFDLFARANRENIKDLWSATISYTEIRRGTSLLVQLRHIDRFNSCLISIVETGYAHYAYSRFRSEMDALCRAEKGPIPAIYYTFSTSYVPQASRRPAHVRDRDQATPGASSAPHDEKAIAESDLKLPSELSYRERFPPLAQAPERNLEKGNCLAIVLEVNKRTSKSSVFMQRMRHSGFSAAGARFGDDHSEVLDFDHHRRVVRASSVTRLSPCDISEPPSATGDAVQIASDDGPVLKEDDHTSFLRDAVTGKATLLLMNRRPSPDRWQPGPRWNWLHMQRLTMDFDEFKRVAPREWSLEPYEQQELWRLLVDVQRRNEKTDTGIWSLLPEYVHSTADDQIPRLFGTERRTAHISFISFPYPAVRPHRRRPSSPSEPNASSGSTDPPPAHDCHSPASGVTHATSRLSPSADSSETLRGGGVDGDHQRGEDLDICQCVAGRAERECNLC